MSGFTEIVARFAFRHDAELARGYLDDAEIESVLLTDDAAGAWAGLPFTNPRLLVRAEDFERARATLEDAGVLEDETRS